MAILSFVFGLIFLVTNVGLKIFKEKPRRDPDPIFEKINEEIIRKMSFGANF
jgi:hypothetical protein